MSATTYKRSRRYRGQSRILNGEYSYDYVTLSLEKDKEMNPKITTAINGSTTSTSHDKDKNAWRKEFTEKLEHSVLNKHIQERLKITAKAQLDWLAPCFRTLNAKGNSAIRRRCFCESIGPKFCEVCRKKVKKELSNRVPRIICDLKNSENELSLLERAEFFVTPEPKFSKHLKQASNFYGMKGYQSLQEDENTKKECLSIENPENHAISRASSYSSLTSFKDHEFLNDVIVPSSPQNSPNTSPVVSELPNINSPESTSSADTGNGQHVLTSAVPQLPAIANDPDIICHQQNSPVTPKDQHVPSDIHKSQPLTNDIPNDPHDLPNTASNQYILADIPPLRGKTNEPDIPNDSHMFHITHQLRSINELKADASSHKNSSYQNIPPQQLLSNFSDSQNENISTVNNGNDLSKTTLSVLDDGTDSSKTDIKRSPSDSNHILPKLPHPVEPVLLELKYINFSIYDYDCKMDK